MKAEKEYPCTDCAKEKDCNKSGRYVRCKQWRDWYHQQWREIRKMFARNVSNRHKKKGTDDSERV